MSVLIISPQKWGPAAICHVRHNNNYINAGKLPKDHNGGSDKGPNPQVIHNVDKKVSYRGWAPAKPGPKRLKNT
jgi:hypothetical protein